MHTVANPMRLLVRVGRRSLAPGLLFLFCYLVFSPSEKLHYRSDYLIPLTALVMASALLWFARFGKTRIKIAALIATYLALMFVFAAVYHYIFLRSPEDAFQFADATREGRAHQQFMGDYSEVIRENRQLYLLTVLEANAEKAYEILNLELPKRENSTNEGGAYLTLVPGYDLRFTHTRIMVQGGSFEGYYIEIRFEGVYTSIGGSDDTSLPRGVLAIIHSKSITDFRKTNQLLQLFLTRERQSSLNRLHASVSSRSDWTYSDFCYFSAMTMTTVGFGDIFPSSPLSRAVVLCHAIVSVFYLGFALSFLWPTDVSDTKPRMPDPGDAGSPR